MMSFLMSLPFAYEKDLFFFSTMTSVLYRSFLFTLRGVLSLSYLLGILSILLYLLTMELT